MKKIFTLLAMTLLTLGVNAETLIDFAQTKDGITLGGTCEYSTVKIHTNTDSKDCIKFANSYTTESELNGNMVTLEIAGGFKAGDVVTIAGVINNSDESKEAGVVMFTLDAAAEHGYNVIWEPASFINSRFVAEDPAELTFTLAEDADKLCFGRRGNTGANIIVLKVVRGEESTIGGGDPEPQPSTGGAINFPTSTDGITISGTTTWDNNQKYHANAEGTKNISFSNGYTSEGVINANWASLSVEGGFKAGDVVTVAGYFNNTDETKQAAVTLFVGAEGEAPTDLWTSNLFINGRTVADDPTPESYTLAADYETLKLGRANGLTGATRTNVCLLTVTRGGETGIVELPVNIEMNAPIYNLKGERVDAGYRGVVIMNGKKMLQK